MGKKTQLKTLNYNICKGHSGEEFITIHSDRRHLYCSNLTMIQYKPVVYGRCENKMVHWMYCGWSNYENLRLYFRTMVWELRPKPKWWVWTELVPDEHYSPLEPLLWSNIGQHDHLPRHDYNQPPVPNWFIQMFELIFVSFMETLFCFISWLSSPCKTVLKSIMYANN